MRLLIWLLLFPLYSGSISAQMLNKIDRNAFLSFHSGTNPALEPASSFLSKSVLPATLLVPASMLGIQYLSHDSLRADAAGMVLASVLLGSSLAWIAKPIIDRKRPCQSISGLIAESPLPSDPSMPSGHSTAAFAMAVSLSLEYPKWQVVLPSLAWAGAVGCSRIVLGHHYPGDVLAGAALGAGSAWLTWQLRKCLNAGQGRHSAKKSGQKQTRIYMQQETQRTENRMT